MSSRFSMPLQRPAPPSLLLLIKCQTNTQEDLTFWYPAWWLVRQEPLPLFHFPFPWHCSWKSAVKKFLARRKAISRVLPHRKKLLIMSHEDDFRYFRYFPYFHFHFLHAAFPSPTRATLSAAERGAQVIFIRFCSLRRLKGQFIP